MSIVKTVIGDKVLVSKINVAIKSELYMPDAVQQRNLTALVRSIGNKVKNSSLQENSMVIVDSGPATAVKAGGNRATAITSDTNYIIKEEDIILIKVGKVWHPYGKNVLIERIHDELKVGSIFIPSCYENSDQSRFGVVAQKGIYNGKTVDSGFEIGDIICIERWDVTIKEIEIDRHYYLSVPNKLISYKCDKAIMHENFVRK